ncbi:hypothetical protein AMTRI_Chr13g121900 [Amborella trichopoda]
MNFDASVRSEDQKAGCRNIIKDSHGNVIFSYNGQISFCNINEAELRIVKGVLRLHNRIIIESDFANVITWCSQPLLTPWKWTFVMDEISIAIFGKEVQFCHIIREKNGDSDCPAKLASS